MAAEHDKLLLNLYLMFYNLSVFIECGYLILFYIFRSNYDDEPKLVRMSSHDVFVDSVSWKHQD